MLKQLKLVLLIAGIIISISTLHATCTGNPINLTFNLDSCNAIGNFAPTDYSEFTPIIEESKGVRLSMVSNSLYRVNPNQNRHSCTPGRNGSPAMCISAYDYCQYQPGNYATLKFDISVTPLTDDFARLSQFSFYEKAPEQFQWTDGATGLNNYPTLYSIRIIKNAEIVYEEVAVPTSRDWTLKTIDFTSNDHFQVRETTTFNIELLAYCPVGVFSGYKVWDLEDIKLTALCEPICKDIVDGGLISLTDGSQQMDICEDDGQVSVTHESETSAYNYHYVLVDADGVILSSIRSASANNFSFMNLAAGTYRIYGASLASGKTPDTGIHINSLVSNECEALSSNFITVDRMRVDAGLLSGGPFTFCVDDGIADLIPDGAVSLAGAQGETQQWVITDIAGTTILGLPKNLSDVNFEIAGAGDCAIWNVSYSGQVDNLEVNQLFSCIVGCMKRSNFIPVTRYSTTGGTLEGGPLTMCIGDDTPDFLASGTVTISGSKGTNAQWLFTDNNNDIIYITGDYTQFDLSKIDNDLVRLWHLSFDGVIGGLTMNSPLSNLSGCWSLSNSIEINREEVNGGTISGDPYYFCVGDGEPDYLPQGSVTLAGNKGSYGQWVVTDVSGGQILALPDNPYEVDFDGVDPGTCDLWHISYNEEIDGLEIGGQFLSLKGCLAKSNFLPVYRYKNSAATISGGPLEYCVGDNEADFIPAGSLSATGHTGANELWLITDSNDVIISIPLDYSEFDFDSGSSGNYKIYHITYDGVVLGLMGNSPLSSLDGCYSLSNPLIITRNNCQQPTQGGILEGGPYIFCLDGQADYIYNLTLNNNVGSFTQWVITDPQGIIQKLPTDITAVNFENVLAGKCIIHSISYELGLTGLAIDNDINLLAGNFSLSNSVNVYKGIPRGGTITGGPFSFCVGDGNVDVIENGMIELDGNTASNSKWIISDAGGSEIIAVLKSPGDYDFDNSDEESNLIWHISYDGVVDALEPGELLSNLSGCFGLSNSIVINKTYLAGGTISGGPYYFCVGDGAPDLIPAGSVTINGNIGEKQQWVLTDVEGIRILDLPTSLDTKDYDLSAAENCLLWSISYSANMPDLNINQPFNELEPCYARSDFITLFKLENTGGTISSIAPIEFCVGDGVPDMIPAGTISLTGNTGSNSQWVITDVNGIIQNLPLNTYSIVDFDNSDIGTCYLYHLSYDGPLTDLGMGFSLRGLGGCYSLSNGLAIERKDCGITSSRVIIKALNSDMQIELQNIGENDIDIHNYKLFTVEKSAMLSDMEILCGSSQALAPEASITLNSIFDDSIDSGELALAYVNPISKQSTLIQYVIWGEPINSLCDQAVRQGLWHFNERASEIPIGLSISYDGSGIGAQSWHVTESNSCFSNTHTGSENNILVKLFPNPVSDVLQLALQNNTQDLEIKLVNKLGQKLFTKTLGSEQQRLTINTSDLKPGLYYVQLTNGTERKIRSFIKI